MWAWGSIYFIGENEGGGIGDQHARRIARGRSFHAIPSTARALAGRLRDRPGGQVAEREQNLFGPLLLPSVQVGQRRPKTFEPKISLAIGALDAVEERRQLDELVPGIQKVQVENLLTGHSKLSEYKTKMPGGKRKRTAIKRPAGGHFWLPAGGSTQPT
jgi:hypothetical protein